MDDIFYDKREWIKIYNLNSFLATLLAAGGLGFSNYWILDHLGLKDRQEIKSNQQILLYSLLFSLPDFAVFLIVQEMLKKIPVLQGNWFIFWSLSLTFVIVIFLTLVFGKSIHSGLYWAINKIRTKNQNSEIIGSTPWQELAECSHGKPQMAYIYDFSHNPLGSGYVRTYSDNIDETFSINLIPFEDDNMKDQVSYQEINQFIQSQEWQEKYKIYRHINLSQKFIIFVLIPISSAE